jgi:hypothetical protein
MTGCCGLSQAEQTAPPNKQALEQTVGATRRLEAPPAAQRGCQAHTREMKSMAPILAIVLATGTGLEPSLVVGILEQRQCRESTERMVHPLFARTPTAWKALGSWDSAKDVMLPREWVVALDGRRLGVVRTVEPKPTGCPSSCDIWLEVAPGQSPPIISTPPGLFFTWCQEPASRPLVVVSQASYRDPAHWKPVPSDTFEVGLLFERFRQVAGEARVCVPSAEAPVPFAYTAQHVRVRAHRDRQGREIASLWLDRYLDTCDAPQESAWMTHTFLLGATPQYLGRELALVDTGDYDADGRSEALFWHHGYNEDGYVLFDDAFRTRVNIYWGYH